MPEGLKPPAARHARSVSKVPQPGEMGGNAQEGTGGSAERPGRVPSVIPVVRYMVHDGTTSER